MQIVEFGAGTLRFLERPPAQAPAGGFIWIFLEREALAAELPVLQQAAQQAGTQSCDRDRARGGPRSTGGAGGAKVRAVMAGHAVETSGKAPRDR